MRLESPGRKVPVLTGVKTLVSLDATKFEDVYLVKTFGFQG